MSSTAATAIIESSDDASKSFNVHPPRWLLAAAALLRSLGFEKVTVVFEQPPAT